MAEHKESASESYPLLEESPVFTKYEQSDVDRVIASHLRDIDYYTKETACPNLDKLLEAASKLSATINGSATKFTDIAQVQKFLLDDLCPNEKPLEPSDLKLFQTLPHDSTLWYNALQSKKGDMKVRKRRLWMLIQHQTVRNISQIYDFPKNIRKNLDVARGYGRWRRGKAPGKRDPRPYLNKMQLATVNMDCIVAGLHMKKCGFRPLILNLANGEAPAAAAHMHSEGGTQEENLFKRSTYYLSLWPHRNSKLKHQPPYEYDSSGKHKKSLYPLHAEHGAVYSPYVHVFRGSEKSGYAMLPIEQRTAMAFLAAQAPINQNPLFADDSKPKVDTMAIYQHKIRAIYRVAYDNGHDVLVLGALGCGIFGNDPGKVSQLFLDILKNEFDGCFAKVIFAILHDHNSQIGLLSEFGKRFPVDKEFSIFSSLDGKTTSIPKLEPETEEKTSDEKPRPSAALLSQVSGGDAKLKSTVTKVRTRDGKIFEEKKNADGDIESTFKAQEPLPTYLAEADAATKALDSWEFLESSGAWLKLNSDNFGKLQEEEEEKSVDTLSIMSYNIWFADENWEERQKELLRIIAEKQPDIMCLQEVTPRFLPGFCENTYIRETYIVSDVAPGNTVTPYGVLIAVKKSVASLKQLQISHLPTNMGRRLLSAEIDVNGYGSMWINTSHLESLLNQEFRIAQLDSIFKTYAAKQGDSFLMGDFNFGDKKLENDSIPSEFTDLWVTYANANNINYLTGDTCACDRLDKILLRSKSWNVTQFEKLGKTKMPSDHLGIFASIKKVEDAVAPAPPSADTRGSVSTRKDIRLDRVRAFLGELASISEQKEAQDVAIIVISETCKVLNCDRTSFFFVDGDHLDLVIAKGADNIRLPISSGFAGACATSGNIVNIPDAYQDDRFNQSFDKKSGYRTKQILVVPIKDPDGTIVGVLQAINKKEDAPFDNIDEELLLSIAQQVGVSIRYAEQFENASRATDQTTALMAYIKSMSVSSTVPSVLFTLNKAASELLDAERCTFYTVDNNEQSMRIVSSDSSIDIQLPLGKGIAGGVGATGKTRVIKDVYDDPQFDSSWDKKNNFRTRSMLVMAVYPEAIPGSTKDLKPLAVVQLINKEAEPEYFTEDDEELLAVLLRFLSPILSHSTLFQKKKKQKEATQLLDLDTKHVRRMPSREMLSIPADDLIEEGDEDEDEEPL